MSFNFTCPFCDQNLDCPDEIHCVEIECPICKNKIVPYPINDQVNDQEMCKEPVINTVSVPQKLASAITFLSWSIISLALILFLIFSSGVYKALKTELTLRRIFTEQKSADNYKHYADKAREEFMQEWKKNYNELMRNASKEYEREFKKNMKELERTMEDLSSGL